MKRVVKYGLKTIALVLLVAVWAGCSTTKYVPKDKYLLNKTNIKVMDAGTSVKSNERVHGGDLKKYLRQQSNSEVLGFWKLQLNVYSLSGRDSTKWINRSLRKIGEAPEIYDEKLTASSMNEIVKAMQNKGFFHATVDTTTVEVVEGNEQSHHSRRDGHGHHVGVSSYDGTNARYKQQGGKLNLTYTVQAGEPYRIRSYHVEFSEEETMSREAYLELRRSATGTRRQNIKAGMLFDTEVLEAERERIATRMRRHGYYYFEKDFLHYEADSALQTNEVRLTMRLADHIKAAPDSVRKHIFTPQTIKTVIFHTEYSQFVYNPEDVDTIHRNGYIFSWAGKKFLRERTLMRFCSLKPNELYSVRNVENTYAQMNSLSPIRYVNIGFEAINDSNLVAIITISKAKVHSLSAELEGTYSAGDWGIAAGVGYQNRNLFNGAEELSLNGRVSYEWRANGGRALEAKADANLRFPSKWGLLVGYQFQNRPDEYTRTIANAAVQYSLSNRRLKQYFNLLEISYVYLPWISDEFRKYFLQSSNMLKYSYEDHFIMDWSYGGSYSTYRTTRPNDSYTTIQYSIETAGNLLYGMSKAFDTKFPKNANGMYEVFNIPYAQYAKADFSLTYNQIFDNFSRLVYHIDAGVAIPYGNAKTIPFEKRYFAGGANSVRGWSMRTLGPGGYRYTGNKIDYNNQAGDFKLTLNLEYRLKIGKVFEWALFTDAGNVWTIREYETQPHGLLTKDFYKQLAWAYGTGIRLDFSFFVFRIDMGIKLYDPSRIYTDGTQWRTAPNGLCWRDDFTFHFAIGHPF